LKTRFLIIIGILITFTITFFILGPSQGHIAEYFLTEEQFQDLVLGDNPHVSDSRNTGNPNECWYQDENGEMAPCLVPAGALDLDPDLSPTYALDFMGGFFYLTILPLAVIGSIIAGLFLVPYFILKRKKIPSRPYMSLILSGLLLYYGITNLISSVNHLSRMLFLIEKGESYLIEQVFLSFLVPIIVLGIAGILLYRSSVIRKIDYKMKIRLLILIGILSYLVLFVIIGIYSNYILESTPDGIGAWTGTAEGMERQVHFDWRTVGIIWIVILTIPGVIIAYKFYERIKK